MTTETPASAQARARLLQAARELFSTNSFEGTTTREIAQKAGLNVSLISYYFEGKEGLFRAVLSDYGRTISASLQDFLGTHERENMSAQQLRQALKTLAENILQSHIDFPEMKVILFREFCTGFQRSRELFDDVFDTLLVRVQAFLEKAKAQGLLRADLHTHSFFLMFVHTIDNYVMMSRSGTRGASKCFRIPEEKEEFLNQLIGILLDGGMKK